MRYLLPILILTGFVGCDRADPVFNHRFVAFGTLVELSLIGVNHNEAESVAALIERDFATMHRAWHAWEPGPLQRTNNLLAEQVTFAGPPSVLALLNRSQQLAEASDHLFNPAIGRLVRLWGFHNDEIEYREPPADSLIQQLVALKPRLSDIKIDGFRLKSNNPAVQLDFGAIGKGYGLDLVFERLRELGIDNALINAGGDLRAIGSRDGHPWRVAIRSPTRGGVFGFVEIADDLSVFTSSSHERSFTWENRDYHHIIDPRTGYPAQGSALVTVMHTDATTADAAATALFVAGPTQWQRIAKQMGIRYVLLVDKSGVVYMSPAMQERVQLTDKRRKLVISEPIQAGLAKPR